ncbi:hypothetical protein SAMN05192558_11430 [Actinokineospora alba]|uniref:PatG C-terminal domain-containing protein n=2 Tax=Actinokineospora alba TaxID=504798 RepID=A0A1H0VI26_9PSEU|nr:hypothetical protein [Actinokineospora alba]TDP67729.1 hypothetical protein C8E96_3279 [Actinokineospora alba]SDJ27280.1 hypothetical protein SAMN05421871_11230 [Actinokineospora alba]SDP77815.1 hypothetical protein SAMN05192558_11430 [Actinokineospora alba]
MTELLDAVDPTPGPASIVPAAAPAPGVRPAGGPKSVNVRYVYAIGRIEPRFPSLGLEKEFAQATGRADTAGLTDRETAHAVLSDPANRYLARQLCWVFSIEGQESYLLLPRDATDLDMVIEAIRPAPVSGDIDVIIGAAAGLAPADMCNGLIVPMLAFDQVYSFDTESFIAAIPRPEALAENDFQAAARELFARIQQLADNAGATDEHRAVNYLAMRYPAIYAHATEQFARSLSLTGVEVTPSRLSGVRTLVNVVFTYTHRTTGVTEKHAARVDVTEQFPFLASPLAPYYDR